MVLMGLDAAEALFLFLALIPLTASIGYPLFALALFRLRRRLRTPRDPVDWPRISLIVSAYNEEKVIREKIEDALRLDYPRDRMEILIPTDGSTDRTDSIVEEYGQRGVALLRSGRNRGKTAALRKAVAAAKGSILVFSDANSLYNREAVRLLARWFSNPKVGCVCGRLMYENRSGGTAERGEKRYWDWDTRQKAWEGASGILLGANGAIFALRRSLAVALPGGQSNDMALPIAARLRGFHAVFEPGATATETTAESVGGEFRRRARIVARGLNGVVFSFRFAARDSLARQTPLGARVFVLFQVSCKKLSRYLAFPALAGMLALGPCLDWAPGRWAGWVLWGGLGAAVAATILRPLAAPLLRRWPSFKYPLAMAAAALAGFWMFLSRRDVSRWKSQR